MRAPADTINNRMTPERISKGNALEDYRDFKSAVDPKTCPGVKPPDLLLTLAQTLTLNPLWATYDSHEKGAVPQSTSTGFSQIHVRCLSNCLLLLRGTLRTACVGRNPSLIHQDVPISIPPRRFKKAVGYKAAPMMLESDVDSLLIFCNVYDAVDEESKGISYLFFIPTAPKDNPFIH
ncbi:hypothetical protein F2P81_012451 [Scophthalmus maximus]|uniref:Uncharacterized protein n=1 Tax=Scophthalmus maximus TaxID=52904 RepID=A0A6A4SKP9_SCOMX|nr:hypothetical protein F2P81_012451 [Scophthalmus maximus]